MGFSPRGHKESDMTEGTKDAYMHCQKTKLWISSQAESEHLRLCFVLLLVSVHSVVSDYLQTHGLKPTRLLCPWDFPGKNT